MEAFERVDDSVIARIKWLNDDTDPNVAEAVEILNRIDRRQLFFFVGQCMIELNDKNQNEALLDSLKVKPFFNLKNFGNIFCFNVYSSRP